MNTFGCLLSRSFINNNHITLPSGYGLKSDPFCSEPGVLRMGDTFFPYTAVQGSVDLNEIKNGETFVKGF